MVPGKQMSFKKKVVVNGGICNNGEIGNVLKHTSTCEFDNMEVFI